MREPGVHNLHLSSGEDIIGEVTYGLETGDWYIVRRPVMPNFEMQYDPEGKPTGYRITLVPLRPYLTGSEDVKIRFETVIYMLPVDARLEDIYRQTTSSLVLPQANPIPTLR